MGGSRQVDFSCFDVVSTWERILSMSEPGSLDFWHLLNLACISLNLSNYKILPSDCSLLMGTALFERCHLKIMVKRLVTKNTLMPRSEKTLIMHFGI